MSVAVPGRMSLASPPDPQPRGGFLRSVGVLVGGASIGHAITAAAMPLLSRLYGPAEFGLLAVFTGVVTTIAVAACLRFDVAVMLPEDDAEAFGLLLLSIGCAATVALLAGVAVLLAPDRVAAALGQPRLAPHLWLLPIGILAAATFSTLQGWFTRERSFGLLARMRVGQSAATAATQIGAGFAGLSPIGLLAGYVMNATTACACLGGLLLSRRRSGAGPAPGRVPIGRLVRAYDRFPKFSTWEALANSAAIYLPIVMIASVATTAEAGYLALAMYAIQAPMTLFGAAIGQVFISRAPEEHRAGRLGAFTAEVFGRLATAGMGPLLAIGIVAPHVFEPVFGSGWDRAGWLVAWMTPWFVAQFLASPISMALHVNGDQRAAMAMQVGALLVRVGAIWVAAGLAPGAVGEAYALSGLVVYAAYAALVLVRVRAPGAMLAAGLARSLPVTVAWVAGAAAFAWLFDQAWGR